MGAFINLSITSLDSYIKKVYKQKQKNRVKNTSQFSEVETSKYVLNLTQEKHPLNVFLLPGKTKNLKME